MQGIGDSAQGAANAILFVMLTKRVRTTLFSLRYWKFRLKLYKRGQDHPMEETDPLLEERAAVNKGLSYSDSSYQDPEIYTPVRGSLDESNIYTFPTKSVN